MSLNVFENKLEPEKVEVIVEEHEIQILINKNMVKTLQDDLNILLKLEQKTKTNLILEKVEKTKKLIKKLIETDKYS